MYQGWHLDKSGKEDTKLGLLADSPDGINWSPAKVSPPAAACAGLGVPNCVLKNGGNEFSVVYDDGPYTASATDRLKCLWDTKNITASPDGESWHQFGEWTAQSVDPDISVFRNPLDISELVVTARPQALRRSSGRHAGYHSGAGWAELAKGLNERALPLDNVFTKTDGPAP